MQACCDHALSHHLDNGDSATNRGFKTQLRVGVLCRLEDGRAATRQELLVSSYHALPGPKRSFHKAMGRIHSTNQLYNDVQRGVSLISLKSSVKRSCGTPGRSMLRSLSSMRATWSSTPVASSISALCSWIKSYTLDPTVPNPKRPIRTTLCTPPSILPDTPSDTNYESSGQRSLLGY